MHPVGRKLEPDVILFSGLSEAPLIAELCKKAFPGHLHGNSGEYLPERQAADPGLAQMHSAAFPTLITAIHKTLVDEGIIGGFHRAHHLRSGCLTVLAEHCADSCSPISLVPHKGRSYAHVKPVIGISEVLELCKVRCIEIHSHSQSPALVQIVAKTSIDNVFLHRLHSWRKLKHVNGVESRLQEYGTVHILSLPLFECKLPCE